MKTRILTAALAMFTVVGFAQKKEIKRAGKAVEKGEFQEAKNYLQQAEAQLANADEDEKADYYLYKGYALIGAGQNVPSADLMAAAEAFQKAAELGHDDAQQGLAAASNALVNGAIADQNSQKYSEAAEKLYLGYSLNKQDTIYLYHAANSAVSAKDFDKAAEFYKELMDLGFTGVETLYTAVNKETGEEEIMATKEQRDLFVKSGNYINPKDKVEESKKGEIAKNLALVYIEKGETDKAIAAMEEAKKENPNDSNLLRAEAQVYINLKDYDKAKEVLEEAIKLEPNDADLYYNVGLIYSTELGNDDEAIKFFEKAIELNPEKIDYYTGLLNSKVFTKEQQLIEEMNNLGTSKKDNERYEELIEQRKQMFRENLPLIEKIIELDPNNIENLTMLRNIYVTLENQEKAEELKNRIAEIQQ